MGSDFEGAVAIVIMGVSGAGKSTIGKMLADLLSCRFLDADDFHPQSNIDKMQKGIPLSEEDRIPWLETLRDSVKAQLLERKNVVLGCSALRENYRELLRSGDPNYEQGTYVGKVKFVLLDVAPEVLASRLEKRAAEGNHFMPPALLRSQLELLQVDEAEGIDRIDATLCPETIVNIIRSSIYGSCIPQSFQNPSSETTEREKIKLCSLDFRSP